MIMEEEDFQPIQWEDVALTLKLADSREKAEEAVKTLRDIADFEKQKGELTPEQRTNFLPENAKLSSMDVGVTKFNQAMQTLGLEEYNILPSWLSWIPKSILPSILKPKILKTDLVDALDSEKTNSLIEQLTSCFPAMLQEKIPHQDKPFTHVEILGTNGFFAHIAVDFLKEKLEKGEVQLKNNGKILLLCGTHTNNGFHEDREPENVVMERVFNDVFKKCKVEGEANLFEIQNGEQKIQVTLESVPVSKWLYRANTVDTIRAAEARKIADNAAKQSKSNGEEAEEVNTLYLAYQPFGQRAEADIENYMKTAPEGTVTDRQVQMCAPSFKSVVNDLQDSERKVYNGINYADIFGNLTLSYVVSELARLVYTRTQLYRKDKTLEATEATSVEAVEQMEAGLRQPSLRLETSEPMHSFSAAESARSGNLGLRQRTRVTVQGEAEEALLKKSTAQQEHPNARGVVAVKTQVAESPTGKPSLSNQVYSWFDPNSRVEGQSLSNDVTYTKLPQ